MRAVCASLIVIILGATCSGGVGTAAPVPAGGEALTESPASPTPSPGSDEEATVAVAVAEPLREMGLEVAFPSLSFPELMHLVDAGDGSGRLFAVLKPGLILVFPNDPGATQAGTFLDITDRVNDAGNEEGLLGLAFDSEYVDHGFFYVYYSADDPRRTVLSRFSVSAGDPNVADPESEMMILELAQPFKNHNGGQLVFGPDGYLYAGLGDGGLFGDPYGNGQNTSTLLGSIVRIDVRSLTMEGGYQTPPDNPFVGVPNARAEIWAYGLRNPWRFTFDRLTGELWAADVGQDEYEEVDIIRAGRNYGWNVLEGSHCYPPGTPSCDAEGLDSPVAEYGHDEGCSITGGYVYRGARLPSLYGAYVYGDYCSGTLWALRYDGARITERLKLADSRLRISSFGEDAHGEVYVLSFDGRIYRFAPR